jgi:aminoglycoside phosphotransferase (APT) family kinase protein
VRSLPALAAEVHAWAEDDDAMAELGPEHRDQWTASAPALVEACRRLHEIGPGPTLVHGDFHPWNVVLGSAGVRIFDWTDAAISHPFVDLATYLPRTTDLSVRRHLLETYLEAWKDQLPADLLQEAGRLAIVVGSLYQVQTYRVLQPTLQGGMFDGSDVRWMKRSIERLRHGLDPQV